MSGILFLGNDDFQIRQGDQGMLLTLTYDSKGLTLVLFYSKECPYCDSLINKFKQLPNFVNGCQFAMVNVNTNMSIVERSKNTVAPITYVPDVILYVNGMPYIRYDGPHDIAHIKEFIISIYQKIQKTAFIENNPHQDPQQQGMGHMQSQGNLPPGHPGHLANQQQQRPGQQAGQMHPEGIPKGVRKTDDIPAYTIGRPICGDGKKEGVCYLNFQKAYVSAT
jgi:thiol-disulfide isomerase/thioredoxin